MGSSNYDASGLGARVRQLRGKDTLAEFSDKFGVHKNTLSRYERGESLPDAGFLAQLCDRIKVNAAWLLTGRGPKNAEGTGEPLCPRKDWNGGPLADDRYVYIPLYNVVVSGGNGCFTENEEVVDALAFKNDWIRSELKANPKDLVLVNMAGESMEPTLGKNDVLLANKRLGVAHTDGIYIVRTGDALLVKRLQFLPGGEMKVISDNPAYEPFMVTPDPESGNFQVIGRVVWVGRKF